MLNLFDDVVFTGIVEHVEPTASGHALWGRLDGVELGTMTMVVNGNVVAGTVRTLGTVYSIRTNGDGTFVIRQIDESSLPPLGEPLEPKLPPRDAPTQTNDFLPDDGSEIDVMVVYTPLAKRLEGGRAAIEALIDLFVAETNQAFTNSGVIHQLNLVLREEVDYIEVGNATDLGRLKDTSDGYMDHVHERRDLYAADFVHFVVGKNNVGGGAIHGGAFAMTASYRTDLVFAHELGHNLGVHHDRYEAGVPVVGSNYGYVNQRMFDAGAPRSARWRTIMAYPNQCSHFGGFHCAQVQYFSNPDNTYKGDPMGVSSDNPSTGVDGPADAVRTFNDRREFHANRRRSLTSPTPRVALTLSPYWLAEDGGVSKVTASLHRPSSADTVVTVSASPTETVALNANRTLTIPAGETVSVDSLTISGVDNGDQTGDVSVEISATAENPSDLGVIAPEPVVLSIADDETTPVVTLSLNPTEVLEGGEEEEGAALGFRPPAVRITAALDNISSVETTVIVSASPAEAVTLSVGVVGGNTLRIPPGQTAMKGSPLYFDPVDDTEFTQFRRIVTLSGAATNRLGVTGPESATLTIIDDDSPMFTDDSITYTFTEGLLASRALPEAVYGNGKLTYSISPSPTNGVTFASGPPSRIGVTSTAEARSVISYTLTAADAEGDTDSMTINIAVREGVCPNSTALSGYSDPGIDVDCEALLSARDALRGDQSLNWSESISLGTWQGVEVANDRIVGVHLASLKLTGTIPSELGNLTSLQSLDLSKNELGGPIPAQLGHLTNLESLVLFRNQLTGPIPSELGNLENLHTLRLDENRLIGEIPSELGRLSNLQELFLSNNQLTGYIPAELSNLSELSRLFLYGNKLSGEIPSWLGGLSNLRLLLIDSNRFTGMIPSELGELEKLEGLSLQGNQLTGKIPTELSKLGNLRALSLQGNQLTGSIPSELGRLSNLKSLHLVRNLLDGPIPPELGNLPNLGLLWLGDNQFTGSIPSELGRLSNLNSLHLDRNLLDGPIPPELGNLPNLGLLWLGDNQLTGPIPSELGRLSNLNILHLGRNLLNGPIPPELGNISNLTFLYLDSNLLDGPIPPELGNLSNLKDLLLSDNHLSGQIPLELGKLANMRVLLLSGNDFTGCVPEVLRDRDIEFNDFASLNLPFCSDHPCVSGGALPDATNTGLISDCEALLEGRDLLAGTATLNWSVDTPVAEWDGVKIGGTPQRVTRIVLHNKGLNGTVPESLGRLSGLTGLYLSNNGLTEPIPAELGDLYNLRVLNLRSNELTGEIPDQLGDLRSLKVLNLHSNNLSGDIPDLSLIAGLEELYLPNNADYTEDGSKVQGSGLTGDIPAWLNGMTNMRELWLWGNSLTGSIPDLSGMTSLRKLKLANNDLTGGVPEASELPPNMTWLIIDRNPLGGTIPNLSSLSRLKLLWLHSNELEGAIPAGNKFPTSLDDLNLRDNMLTGTIPDLSNLDNLTRLRLHNNSLSGEVPATLGSLDSLRQLWLHNEVDKGLGNNSFTSIAAGVGGLADSLIEIALNGNPWANDACVPAELANVAKNDYTEAGIEVCESSDGS